MRTKSICLFVFLSAHFLCIAQSVQEQMTKRQPDCRDVSINVSDILPKLYAEKSFDSMRVAITVMEQFCSVQSPKVFYMKMLLDIQESTFSISNFSTNGRFDTLLHIYIFTLKTLKNGGYAVGNIVIITILLKKVSFIC